jgi:hypothetical protein
MDGFQRVVPVFTLIIALAAVAIAFALLRSAGETGDLAEATEKRACIEAAAAKYPAVGVSAFVTASRRDTGPIKLSFEKERRRAVDACN